MHASKRIATAIIVAIGLMITPAAEAQTARNVAKRVTPSVVLLVMQDENNQPLQMGSGFVVRDGVIATNLHVVAGTASGYAKLSDQKEKRAIAGTVGVDQVHDLAILSVPGAKAPPLTLGKSDDAAAGDEVYAIGNPQGLEGTISAGIISGVRTIGADTILQITAPISPGSSGGPVTNKEGEVIGVSVATFKGGQNLNFAIPSKYIEALLAKPTPVAALAKSSKPQPAKAISILNDLGGGSTDGVEGTNFTWDSEGVQQSGEYSFSLKNKLQTDIRNVSGLIVFYDEAGSPIDVHRLTYRGTLPSGLAKRVKGEVDESVEKLNTKITDVYAVDNRPPRKAKGRIEFRILQFQVGNSNQPDDDKAREPAVDDPN